MGRCIVRYVRVCIMKWTCSHTGEMVEVRAHNLAGTSAESVHLCVVVECVGVRGGEGGAKAIQCAHGKTP